MELPKVFIRPVLKELIDQHVEFEEIKNKLRAVLGETAYVKVEAIIEKEPFVSRKSAFYETIFDAASFGADFSKVKNLKDIADVYAKYVYQRYFGGGNR